MNSDMPPILGTNLGGNFDTALASVGPLAANPLAGMVPPTQETIDMVISLQGVLAEQQGVIQADKELQALGAQLQTLQSELMANAEITLTPKQLRDSVQSVRVKGFLSTKDQMAIDATMAQLEKQLQLRQARGSLDLG